MAVFLAIDVGDDLKIVDGVVYKGDKIAKPDDAPLRHDLPRGHPLRETRAVKVVMSGMPDCVIGADGKLEPIDKPDPGPIDPIIIAEIERP